MRRLRLFRLRRAYRTIAKVETALGPSAEAVELRLQFAQHTVDAVARMGGTRAERKRLRRMLSAPRR